MTTPPSAPSARCRATSTSRTRGSRATAVAALSISGVRIARVTSWPSIDTTPPSTTIAARCASAATAASSSREMPVVKRLPADGPIHRAGVDVPIAERLGQRARDGALAGP